MAEKTGVCDGCGTHYKIPPTFTGTSARCKKCGGTIAISEASEARKPRPEAAAAPAVEPPLRRSGAAAAAPASSGRPAGAATRTREGSRSGRLSGRAARAGGGRRERPEGKKSNLVLYGALGGVLLLGGGAGAFFLMKGDEDLTETTTTASASEKSAETSQPGPGSAAGAGQPLETPAVPDAGASAAAGTPVESAPTTVPSEPAPEDPTPAEVVTLIEFEPLDRTSSTTDTEWTEIQAAIEGMKSGGRQRARSMDKLVPFGLKAVPAVINTLSGTDLTNDIAWRDAFEVAVFLQDKLTFGTIRIPFKGDFSTDPKDIVHNYKTLTSLVEYWRSKAASATDMVLMQEKYEENKAKAGGGDE